MKRPAVIPYIIRYINDLPMGGKVGAKNVYFSVTNEAITVEEMVLSYYKEEFHYEGCHDEGRSLCECISFALF